MQDDLDIPWKRYRREKISREALPPQPVAAWYRGPNPRFPRPGAIPTNIIQLPTAPATTDREDDESLPR
ncbi:hypothetical protein [Luteolibacter sp. Populi]|uniref:hypothetical protein n=1 Tax=Luteolibacter sp. Populi TaxID=3230487 RepID=UPI003467A0FA